MGYQIGQFVQAAVTQAPLMDQPPYSAANLVNDYGMPGREHDAHPLGSTMWLVRGRTEAFDLIFDLQESVPLEAMWFWNYNRPPQPGKDFTLCGLREVTLFHSVDGIQWTELGTYTLKKADGKDKLGATDRISFEGRTLRFVKMTVSAGAGRGNHDAADCFGGSFGLSKVRFEVGAGLGVCRAPEWSAVFARTDGWTGSDGVFSIPMNGSERYVPGTGTTFTFGDTLLDHIDPETMHRSPGLHMIHNSSCFLPDSLPSAQRAAFSWGMNSQGDDSLLCPPATLLQDPASHGYYWPQDSILVGGVCYTFPFTVVDWPEGPEGFQFKVDGVATVCSPVVNGMVDFQRAEHYRSGLYWEDGQGNCIYYGGCAFPNTKAGGAAEPDGYIYLFGTIHRGGRTSLCAARVREEEMGPEAPWRFYDGRGWSDQIADSAGLADGVSCEFSISRFGQKDPGYLLVYQENINTPWIACRKGPTPVGPFGPPVRIFFTDEVLQGRGIYTYNAKGHPHLTPEGELLISYNVNTIAWEMHERHGDICRPQFIRLYEVVK